ncbi:phospholipase A1 [Ixodes scapularis]|uniref:phospholipase A1 n=1 Tax=Ixodes scapularis TaxID=6945 RepID=UPI001C390427|nr:phospholipase A1 [Ixodes scapularis]
MVLSVCFLLALMVSQTLGRGVDSKLSKVVAQALGEKAHAKDCCQGRHRLTEAELQWGKELVQNVYIASETVKRLPKTAFYSDEEVCYDGLGCFSQLDDCSHSITLPSSPEEVKTKFALYDRQQRANPVYLDYLDNSTLDVDKFNGTKDLVFLVHGFGESGNSSWILQMKDAFLDMEDVNVVAVDWEEGCLQPMYITAAANTALVGRQISRLLQLLTERHPRTVVPARVHVVGFSLGAQVAGFAGRHFGRTTETKIGRISALDAAGPLFESYNFHVCKEDARFVDAIHTSAGNDLLKGSLGMEKPFGDANFYPNGGRSQPGCWFFDIACHHRRAVEYFMESIQSAKSCRFRAHKCPEGLDAFLKRNCSDSGDDLGEMGYHSPDAKGRGEQYLWTNDDCPFCLS